MYVEQKLAECRSCGRTFAVQYAYAGTRAEAQSTDIVTALTITCPEAECGGRERLILPFRLHEVLVKKIWSLERVVYALAGA